MRAKFDYIKDAVHKTLFYQSEISLCSQCLPFNAPFGHEKQKTQGCSWEPWVKGLNSKNSSKSIQTTDTVWKYWVDQTKHVTLEYNRLEWKKKEWQNSGLNKKKKMVFMEQIPYRLGHVKLQYLISRKITSCVEKRLLK